MIWIFINGRHKWYGYAITDYIASVSSVAPSISYCYDKGKYGIYLRNWSGIQCNGNVTIRYK